MIDLNNTVALDRSSEKLLSIEVTSHCNIQCLHCFVNHQMDERVSLSFKVVKSILKEGYDIGYHRLHFTGGEPLLWKDLFKALDYVFYLGYNSVLINTNGTLLSKEICDELASYNGVMVTVSIDGPEELHNHIRGEGSYKHTIQGIENAVDAFMEPIIFTTVYKSLLPELSYFAMDLFSKFPTVKYVSLIPLEKAGNNGFALTKELLEPDDFVRLARTVPFLNLAGLKMDILNYPLARVVSKQLKNPVIQWSSPIDQKRSVIVMANGEIRPSHFSQAFFGQYEPGMLQEVLGSSEYKKQFSPNDTICSYCNYSQVCKENGLFQPLELTTAIINNGPYCRRVLDMIILEKYQRSMSLSPFTN